MDEDEIDDQAQPIKRAAVDLGLTPQELSLYERHLGNLWGPGGRTTQRPGDDFPSRQTLYIGTEEQDGRHYLVPSIYGGEELSPQQAWQQAKEQGLDTFPSYPSREQAEARYGLLHKYMEDDTRKYFQAQGYQQGGEVQPANVQLAEAGDVRRFGDFPGRDILREVQPEYEWQDSDEVESLGHEQPAQYDFKVPYPNKNPGTPGGGGPMEYWRRRPKQERPMSIGPKGREVLAAQKGGGVQRFQQGAPVEPPENLPPTGPPLKFFNRDEDDEFQRNLPKHPILPYNRTLGRIASGRVPGHEHLQQEAQDYMQRLEEYYRLKGDARQNNLWDSRTRLWDYETSDDRLGERTGPPLRNRNDADPNNYDPDGYAHIGTAGDKEWDYGEVMPRPPPYKPQPLPPPEIKRPGFGDGKGQIFESPVKPGPYVPPPRELTPGMRRGGVVGPKAQRALRVARVRRTT